MSAETTATAAPATSASNWIRDGEDYLVRRGWRPAGLDDRNLPTFDDPAGHADQQVMDRVKRNVKGREVEVFEPRQTVKVPLRTRDGNVEEFRQVVGPPVSWTYRLEDALALQRQRDDNAAAEQRREEAKAAAKAEGKQPAETSRPGGPKMVSSTSGRK